MVFTEHINLLNYHWATNIYLARQQNEFSELCPLDNFKKENGQLIKLWLRFSTAILRKFQIPKVLVVMPEGYESFIKQKQQAKRIITPNHLQFAETCSAQLPSLQRIVNLTNSYPYSCLNLRHSTTIQIVDEERRTNSWHFHPFGLREELLNFHLATIPLESIIFYLNI